MTDQLHRLSEEVARNPSGRAWGPLADTLRRQGQLDAARLVALRGLERHPYAADAHDVLARVYADAGDFDGARDEWDMALQLDPDHVASRKGLAFLAFRSGDAHRAAEWLASALERAPGDAGLQAAYERARAAAGPARSRDRRRRSDEITEPFGHAAVPRPTGAAAASPSDATHGATITCDRDGLVLQASDVDAEQADAIAAHAASLLADAEAAAAHLGLGACAALLLEGGTVACALAPAGRHLVIEYGKRIPLGLLRTRLERAAPGGAA